MSKYRLVEAYKDLPDWAKGVIFVGAALGVTALALTVKNAIKKGKENKDSRNWESEKADLERKFQPSFTNAEYSSMSNQIYNAVKQGIGDDYGKVVEVLKRLKNNLDVANMVTSYGKRQRYVFGIPSDEPLDLFTTVSAELGNEYGGLTSYRVGQINSDWAKKGITYKI